MSGYSRWVTQNMLLADLSPIGNGLAPPDALVK